MDSKCHALEVLPRDSEDMELQEAVVTPGLALDEPLDIINRNL
jgi:hypothetical protein